VIYFIIFAFSYIIRFAIMEKSYCKENVALLQENALRAKENIFYSPHLVFRATCPYV